MPDYDSSQDTKEHISRVSHYLNSIVRELSSRAVYHDHSKLQDPEKVIFDEYTPKLKSTTYGSDEYKKYLTEMGKALSHHYKNNRHHPEHFENGIDDMNLIDVIEMLCDWKAATERHEDGSIEKSLEINKSRFAIGDQLTGILKNTVKETGWIERRKS